MHRLFTEEGLARHIRAGDWRRFKLTRKSDRKDAVQAAVQAAANPPEFTNYHRAIVKRKSCFTLKSYPQNLILRAITAYVVKRFRVRARGRDEIVRDVIETLSDATPMYILRRDIQSFYETVPTIETRQKILFDTFMPTRLRAFVKKYFEIFSIGDYGVPRGVGLSAVIAELAMQKTDQKIRELPGVYKYFRYSDDILIFSFRPIPEISQLLRGVFPPPLKLNPKKQDDVSIECDVKTKAELRSFEYLGYRFSFLDDVGSHKPRPVTVDISNRKLAKLKSRVICSFKAYAINGDAPLLIDRIRFAAGNYRAFREGASMFKTSRHLRSGIFYSYPLCGSYAGRKVLPHSCAELKAFDAFYHSLLSGPSSSFRAMFALNPPLLARLKEISFFKGYQKRMMVRFAPDRVRAIKEAWRNG